MTKTTLLVLLALLPLARPAAAGGLSKDFLLSSAWCSVSTKKDSGKVSQKQFNFFADGYYYLTAGKGAETGKGPKPAGRRDANGGGRWRLVRGELYLSDGRGKMEFVATQLRRDPKGGKALTIGGVDYTPCP